MSLRRLRLAATALVVAAAGLAAPTVGATAAPTCDPGEWAAEFFDGTGLAGAPVLERCDPAVDFDWTAAAPGPGVGTNQFSARWTRTDTFEAGDHRFTATADDGIRVFVDGDLVLNGWADQSSASYAATVPLTAGQHTVVVEYYEAWGDAEARASYLRVAAPVGGCEPSVWTAELFTGQALAGEPVVQRCDAAVDFDWGAGAPDPALPANKFSARWTRTIDFDAGSYDFSATADDGVRIRLDGAVVVDGWADQSGVTYSETVPVTAGPHTVVVEYYEAYGDATVSARVRPTPGGSTDCEPDQWAASFYAGQGLAGAPVVERCDDAIDFDWNAGAPDPALPVNKFSARWTKTVTLQAGSYEFRADADDGIRVSLDDTVVIDGWKDQSAAAYTETVGVTAGAHTLTVEYYEAYGDALAKARYLKSDAPDPRSVTGEWTQNPTDAPVRSIHSTLLPGGKVLMVAGSGNNQLMFAAGTFTASVWDPVANTFEDIPVPEDMFCSGHAHLADGNVMLAGGNKFYPNAAHGFGGLASNYEFDVEQNRFVKLPDMQAGRWYPTLTMLGNGDITVVGGLDESGNGGAVLVERFDSETRSWLDDVSQRWAFWGLYPSLHLMDDGQLFYSGTNTFGNALPGSATWDLETDTVQDLPLSHPDLRDQSASVLLPPAQDQTVMVLGGGNSYSGQTATASTYLHDLATGQHYEGPPLPTTKMYVNAAILPDRTVLETGGAEAINTNPKHETSIYDPASNTFTPVPGTPAIDRLYHSSALLLADGRVAVIGSNPDEGTFEMRISIYSPGYLFKGPRPTIDAAPEVMDNGSTYDVAVTAPRGVRDVSLIRAGSVTHQFDPNLRLVDVPFTETAAGLSLDVPDNPNLLPPGPYMLVVTDQAGVPSVASWVEVPTQPGSAARAGTPTGAVSQAVHHEGHAADPAPQCVPGLPELCCCEDGKQADAEAPWWAPDENGLRPGEIDYGPDGGPQVTATTLGDGCDHNYRGRRASVCVPTLARRAPDLGKAAGEAVTCAALRREGYLRRGLKVVGEDTQGLDPDGDTVACEKTERTTKETR